MKPASNVFDTVRNHHHMGDDSVLPLHAFVVLAYKKSPYLEGCIQSVLAQTYPSRVIIATSTPNAYIKALAKKYHLRVVVNHDPNGIAGDFDFALQATKTPLLTIAHQDDLYDSNYASRVVDSFNKRPGSLIIFTDYYEIRQNEKVYHSPLLKIKRTLLLPLRFSRGHWRFTKRLALRFGDPICCPAVTFNISKVKPPLFSQTPDFLTNVDWSAWEILSRQEGDFTYLPQPLMGHRVHNDSTTSMAIQSNSRSHEDYLILRRFWPRLLARLIARLDSKSEKYNQT